MPGSSDVRVIGIDISGDFGSGIRGGLVDGTGAIVARKEALTPLTGEADLVEAISTMGGRLAEGARRDGNPPTALGVAVPGLIDEASGVVKRSPNLPLQGSALASALSARLGLPVFLVHDTGAGALAESILGAGRGVADMLLVGLGAGVGGAVISGGRLLVGATASAGEIGHISADPAGLTCGCGGRGCLETLASERALALRYTMASKVAVLPEEVLSRAAQGDALARRVWNEAMVALATVVSTAAILIDCAMVVLAGPTALPGASVGPLRTLLPQRMNLVRPPRVELSSLGPTAGVLGAAVAALERSGMGEVTRAWREAAPPPVSA